MLKNQELEAWWPAASTASGINYGEKGLAKFVKMRFMTPLRKNSNRSTCVTVSTSSTSASHVFTITLSIR